MTTKDYETLMNKVCEVTTRKHLPRYPKGYLICELFGVWMFWSKEWTKLGLRVIEPHQYGGDKDVWYLYVPGLLFAW